jgi:hypothetical protein
MNTSQHFDIIHLDIQAHITKAQLNPTQQIDPPSKEKQMRKMIQ